MTEPERWRPIPGYDGYEVSDRGHVRSLERVVIRRDGRTRPVTAQYLKLGVGDGWPGNTVAYLWRDGKRKEHSVQRLVYSAFVGDCPSRMPRRLDGGGKNAIDRSADTYVSALPPCQKKRPPLVFSCRGKRPTVRQKTPPVLTDSPNI